MSATIKIWSNGVAPTCEDDDLNGFKNENNNLIVGSGQGLSTADNQQTHKAVAHYVGVGDYYVDSGVANAYVLSTTGSQVAPPTYATGMRIRFVAGNANTGASTVNVAGLGVKALVKDSDGSSLFADNIPASTGTEAYYDGTSFRVVTELSVSGVWTPTIEGATIAGAGWVFGSQIGNYTRQGNLLYLNFLVQATTISPSATGNLHVKGFPFTPLTSNTGRASGSATGISGITFTAGYTWITLRGVNTGDAIAFNQEDATSPLVLNVADASGVLQLAGSIVLEVS